MRDLGVDGVALSFVVEEDGSEDGLLDSERVWEGATSGVSVVR